MLDRIHDAGVPDEIRRAVVGHVDHRLRGRRGPAPALPAEEEGHPHRPFEQALLHHPHGVPDATVVEGLDLELHAKAPGDLAVFLQLLAVVNGVEFDRLLARLVVETLVVGVEARRDHVRALVFHQQLPLREAAVGDAVLDDRIDVVGDAGAQLPPAGDIEIGELCAVGLDLRVDRVGTVQVADRGTGIDRADIVRRHRVDPLRRRVVRVRRIRHRRVARHGDDQLFHRSLCSSTLFSRS